MAVQHLQTIGPVTHQPASDRWMSGKDTIHTSASGLRIPVLVKCNAVKAQVALTALHLTSICPALHLSSMPIQILSSILFHQYHASIVFDKYLFVQHIII